LLLLRDKEVIKPKEGVGFKPKLSDITDNPGKPKFIEIDAAQSPRALDDVDAAAINTNYATQARLDPVKDPILREDPKGPYVNLIAVRAADKDKPWVKTLAESYHTPEVKERWPPIGRELDHCRLKPEPDPSGKALKTPTSCASPSGSSRSETRTAHVTGAALAPPYRWERMRAAVEREAVHQHSLPIAGSYALTRLTSELLAQRHDNLYRYPG
jgi:hypothetical protein